MSTAKCECHWNEESSVSRRCKEDAPDIFSNRRLPNRVGMSAGFAQTFAGIITVRVVDYRSA